MFEYNWIVVPGCSNHPFLLFSFRCPSATINSWIFTGVESNFSSSGILREPSSERNRCLNRETPTRAARDRFSVFADLPSNSSVSSTYSVSPERAEHTSIAATDNRYERTVCVCIYIYMYIYTYIHTHRVYIYCVAFIVGRLSPQFHWEPRIRIHLGSFGSMSTISI